MIESISSATGLQPPKYASSPVTVGIGSELIFFPFITLLVVSETLPIPASNVTVQLTTFSGSIYC
jgi:hypothetical protein